MTQSPTRVLVLGAGYGGMLALSRLRRSRQPLAITLVDAKPHFEQRLRLHEAIAGQPVKSLHLKSALQPKGVEVVEGRVETLAPNERRVRVVTSAGTIERAYDYLIYALGSRMSSPDIPGGDEHMTRIDTLTQAQAAHRSLRQKRRITVVGGGLTGIELSTELAERHPQSRITLVTAGGLGDGFPEPAARHLRATFEQLGIQVLPKSRVTRAESNRVRLHNNAVVEHDACFWAGGFDVSPLPQQAGLPIDDQGRVLTNPCLQVLEQPRLFAVGDAAHVSDGQGRAFRMGCVNAMPQGAQAGDNLRALLEGRAMTPYAMGYVFQCLSLGRDNGLIQYTDARDRPTGPVWRHRPAVWTKELICKMTYSVIQWELRTGLPLYHWRKTPITYQANDPADRRPSHAQPDSSV